MGLDDVQLHLVDSFDQASQMMTWLGSQDAAGCIAVDTETTGLIHGKDTVRLAQLGGFIHGWAIPYHLWPGLFREAVTRYDGDIIMHNKKFDYGMLALDSRVPVLLPRGRTKDSMVAAAVNEPHTSKALKSQASRHIDAAAAGLQVNFAKTDWTWDTVPYDYGPYWQYGALDTVLTKHLWHYHEPIFSRESPAAFDLEDSYVWTAYDMERRGVHIDIAYARQKYDSFMSYVKRAETWIWDQYRVKAGSNAAIIKILEGDGIVFDKKTASGALALDKEVLGGLDHPLAQTVLKRRQLQKLATTYLHHFITEVDSDDIIHPSINTIGARTSRVSMSEPNMQNLPRASEANPAATTIRNAITSRYGDQGRLLMCDFDQIEMRLMAHMSQDPGLTAAFKSQDDFFVSLARQIFQDETIQKKDPRRQITKNAGYATIYSAGVAKFAATAGISFEQGQIVRNRWNQLYPGTTRFAKEIDSIARANQRAEGMPYIRSPLTNRRQVADENKIYALVNYAIQMFAAEVFKLKQLEMAAAGLDKFMCIPVHDEIILDVPESDVRDVVHTLHSIMNDMETFSVPISASVSHGARWGEKEDLILNA
jgi:DNA polymerase-1